MKRSTPLRHLRKQGCYLKREGRLHSLWSNPRTGAVEAIPRHVEIVRMASPARFAEISLSPKSLKGEPAVEPRAAARRWLPLMLTGTGFIPGSLNKSCTEENREKLT